MHKHYGFVMAYVCLAFVSDYIVTLLMSKMVRNDDAYFLRFLSSGSQANVFNAKEHEKHGVKSALKSCEILNTFSLKLLQM